MRSTLKKAQARKKYAAVNSARDKAFIQHAAYTRAEVEGYEIDKKLSNPKGTVYRNKATGKVTIGFAGTQISKKGWKQGAKDIMADIHIATATEADSEEFKKAERQYKAVVKKYGAENVDVTGHSLGGTKAAYLSHKYGVHAETFNQGASPTGSEEWNLTNVTAHVSTGDVVPFGVNILKESGTGVNVQRYHRQVGKVALETLKKEVMGAPEGAAKKKAVVSAGEVLSTAASTLPRVIGKGLLKGGELAPVIAAVGTATEVETKLHSSDQFVPKGKPDASSMEKPPDSKPIPTPAPIPKPTPAPAPTIDPYHLSHSRYARLHLGSGGV